VISARLPMGVGTIYSDGEDMIINIGPDIPGL
jgi:hypothetical protein